MPEESNQNPSNEALDNIARRLKQIEDENRWWRGGAIAATSFLAIALLLLAFHPRHDRRFPMGAMMAGGYMAGMQGPRFMPYPPPPGPGPYMEMGPCGRSFGHHHRWHEEPENPQEPPKG